MLNSVEQDWVVSMLHACPSYHYFTNSAGKSQLERYICDYIMYTKGEIDDYPLPDSSFGRWVHQLVDTCKRPFHNYKLDQEMWDYAVEMIKHESSVSMALEQPEILYRILNHVIKVDPSPTHKGPPRTNVRNVVQLSQVNRHLNAEIKAWGYDPFAEGRSLPDLPRTTLLNGQQRRVELGQDLVRSRKRTHDRELREENIRLLALHAFNVIYAKVGCAPHKKRTGLDEDLTKISATESFTVDGRKTLIQGNCLAKSEGQYAVNFVKGYSKSNRERLLARFAMNSGDYDVLHSMHAEMRRAEKMEGKANSNRISVDKPCCAFCTIQLIAMGQFDRVSGGKTGVLQWYTFTPYVMYFKMRRREVWGAQIESIFALLPPDDKLLFLNVLAQSCRSFPYTDLRPLEEVQLQLLP